jgi:hypothetical protein
MSTTLIVALSKEFRGDKSLPEFKKEVDALTAQDRKDFIEMFRVERGVEVTDPYAK